MVCLDDGGWVWGVCIEGVCQKKFDTGRTYAKGAPKPNDGDQRADLKIAGIVRSQAENIDLNWDIWENKCSDSAGEEEEVDG